MSKARIDGATGENYGSFKRVEYQLADLGLVLVEGRNLDDPRTPSNGAGKSTLFLDGPTWCNYGEARKGIAADDVVNDGVGRNCAWTNRLTVPGVGPVSIQRYRKVASKAGLRLWVGAHVQDLADAQTRREELRPFERTSLDTAETQREIERVLGMGLEVWRSAVYRAQDDDSRFAALTDGAQKDLLTRAFQIDVIDGWRDAAGARADELRDQLGKLTARLTPAEVELRGLQLEEHRAAHAAWEADKAARLASLDAELEGLRAEWEAAKVVTQRRAEIARRRDELRAAPPSLPPLELAPPQPRDPPPVLERAAPAPPAPSPAPYEPPLPVAPLHLPPPPDLSRPEGEQRAADQAVANITAAITALRGQAAQMRQRAGVMRTKRAGTCPECGSQLTPEHADRCSAQLEAEAGQVDAQAAHQEGAPLAEARRHAAAAAAALARYRHAHAENVRGLQAAHQHATQVFDAEVVRRQVEARARAAQQDAANQIAYRQARAAWEQEIAAGRRRWDEQRAALWSAWQREQAAVAERNAMARAHARGDYDARLAALEAELEGMGHATSTMVRLKEAGTRKRAERDQVAATTSRALMLLQQAEDRAQVLQAEIATVAAERVGIEAELRLAEWWVEGFGAKGLKSWVLDERIQELTDRANEWLRVLTSGVYWVRFETQSATQKGKIVDKFATRVFRHLPSGRVAERRWGQWSGGQKGRVGVGIDLALADAIAARASRGWDILVLDEIFRGLDDGGRQAMLDALNVLRRTRGTCIVVDHDAQMKAAFEHRLVVEMRHEESRYLGVVA